MFGSRNGVSRVQTIPTEGIAQSTFECKMPEEHDDDDEGEQWPESLSCRLRLEATENRAPQPSNEQTKGLSPV